MGIDFCRWAEDVCMGAAFSSDEDGLSRRRRLPYLVTLRTQPDP